MPSQELCEVVGFPLRPHYGDRFFVGSHYACRAEKQLATYYIDQHFFWGDQVQDSNVTKLRYLNPLVPPSKAVTVVSRPVFQGCVSFLELVQDFFNVEILRALAYLRNSAI